MPSAGCVINDFADRDFDGAVERTKKPSVRTGQGQEKRSAAADGIFVPACRIVPDSAESSDLADEPARAVSCADFLPVYQTLFSDSPIPIPGLCLFTPVSRWRLPPLRGNVPPQAWILFAANTLWTPGV